MKHLTENGHTAVRDADVTFMHLGENDFKGASPTPIGHCLYMLALEPSTPLRRRRVINNELFPFPVHRREWSMEAKETLRAVTERNAEPKIRLWRMRRSVNRLAYASDGVHVSRHNMHQYWAGLPTVHFQMVWSPVKPLCIMHAKKNRKCTSCCWY
jgi:hypothetical protein